MFGLGTLGLPSRAILELKSDSSYRVTHHVKSETGVLE